MSYWLVGISSLNTFIQLYPLSKLTCVNEIEAYTKEDA
jgi:hypothetical protein